MNKMLLGSVALVAMTASSAMAADYAPRRAATFAEPAASWTGVYIGGNIGGVWGNTDPGFIAGCPPSVGSSTLVGGVLPNQPSATCYAPSGAFTNAAGTASALNPAGTASVLTQVGTQPFHNRGWEGGVQIGFNYQYQWAVFGVEADLQAFRPKGSQNVTGTYPLSPLTVPCSNGAAASFGGGCQFGFNQSSDGRWMTSVRGKVGAVWGNWLFYGTMGVAWARMSFTSNFADATGPATFNPACVAPCGGLANTNLVSAFTVTQTKAGPIGGFGVSYMLTRNLIFSVEYLRAEIWGVGGDTLAVTTAASGVGAGAAPGTFNSQFHYDTTFIENIVRAKLDFKL